MRCYCCTRYVLASPTEPDSVALLPNQPNRPKPEHNQLFCSTTPSSNFTFSSSWSHPQSSRNKQPISKSSPPERSFSHATDAPAATFIKSFYITSHHFSASPLSSLPAVIVIVQALDLAKPQWIYDSVISRKVSRPSSRVDVGDTAPLRF